MLMSALKRQVEKSRPTLTFFTALIKNPKATGAVLPSSKYLARTMAACLPTDLDGLVIELGPGTGVITQAILARGIAPANVIAIEFSAPLAAKLRERFPEIHVIEGNAAELSTLLADQPRPIAAVISGLPLRSLPKKLCHAILAEVPKVLSPQGRFIQFTYDLRRKKFFPDNYILSTSRWVWRNVPPAKVDVFYFNESTLERAR